MTDNKKFTPPHPLNTAVLFLVFNRPDTTKQVFEAIRQAKPPRLYVAADGARETKEGEGPKVQAVREYIMQNIDWECEVKTLFREQNYGCKMAVSGAIDWFFENEEMGIILEDDCLPSQSFFWYCEELLERYKHDNNVKGISGYSVNNNYSIEEDYLYVSYALIWGWATWRRVWQRYEVGLDSYLTRGASNFMLTKEQKNFWIGNFEKILAGKLDTWDYQLSFQVLDTNSLFIVPKYNLISNIGFSDDATHTFNKQSEHNKKQNFEINLPTKTNNQKDTNNLVQKYYDNRYVKQKMIKRIIKKASRMILKSNIIK